MINMVINRFLSDGRSMEEISKKNGCFCIRFRKAIKQLNWIEYIGEKLKI